MPDTSLRDGGNNHHNSSGSSSHKRKTRDSTGGRGGGDGTASGMTRDGKNGSRNTPDHHASSNSEKKTFMDRWVEPSLAAPSASYREHGGSPHGVLEHMQPLGEAPSARVRGRAKTEGGNNGGSRKSVLGRSAAGSGGVNGVAERTPEGSPAPMAAEASTTGVVVPADDEKDEDYAPGARQSGRRTRQRAVKSLNNRRERADSEASNHHHETPTAATRKTNTAPPATPTTATTITANGTDSKTGDTVPVIASDRLDRVVEDACVRARTLGRPDLGDTVLEIYHRSRGDARLADLLQAILTYRATEAQHAEFQQYVREVKRGIKGAAKQGRHSTSGSGASSRNGRGNRSPRASTTTSTSTPAAAAAALNAAATRDLPRPKLSLKLKGQPKASTADQANGSAPARSSHNTPNGKKRSTSVGSDSSLTSFTSDDGRIETPAKLKLTVHPAGGKTRASAAASTSTSADPSSLPVPPTRGAKRSSTEAALDSGDDFGPSFRRTKGKPSTSKHAANDHDQEQRERALAAAKSRLSQTVTRDYDYEESNIRPSLEPAPATLEQQQQGSAAKGRPLRNRTAGQTKPADDGGDDGAMALDSPLSDLSPVLSGRSTPVWKGSATALPASMATGATVGKGKRAKTKQSPEKKQNLAVFGAAASAGGPGVGKDSPIGDDDNDEAASENNDFCSACGGTGYLLCCDGCDRSFHFSCLDPPLSEDAKELDEPWYCYVCLTKRPGGLLDASPEKATRGLFAPLFATLKKQNPTNYILPAEIRDFFEGVATDKQGGFVEAVTKTTRHRPGYSDEQPDHFRERDSKGNLILCYNCGLASHRQYAIVTCDFCGQHWHLDCLDPPLANPPAVNQNGKKVIDWMCPLHADQELRTVDTGILGSGTANRRRFHLRKPKNAKHRETHLTRGFRNNGIIEVLDDLHSDSSDSEFYEQEDGPVVYKLPAKGIILDFIDKVKVTRVQRLRDETALCVHNDPPNKRRRPHALGPATPTTAEAAAAAAAAEEASAKPPSPELLLLEQANFAKRPFVEKSLALNLAQFASEQQQLDLGRDQVENLVGMLIAEAPLEVIEKMTATEAEAEHLAAKSTPPRTIPPSPPSSEHTELLSPEQRRELELLQELIRRRLEGGKV